MMEATHSHAYSPALLPTWTPGKYPKCTALHQQGTVKKNHAMDKPALGP